MCDYEKAIALRKRDYQGAKRRYENPVDTTDEWFAIGYMDSVVSTISILFNKPEADVVNDLEKC